MCLTIVHKRRPELKNIKEKLAWKVFHVSYGRNGRRHLRGKHFSISNLRVNKWLKAAGEDAGGTLSVDYPRGFHSFPALYSAQQYGYYGEVIRAVKVKYFLAVGKQDFYGLTYVTRYMKVLSKRESERLKKLAKG